MQLDLYQQETDRLARELLAMLDEDEAVPVSAYDAFAQLHRDKLITDEAMRNWTAAIGLRNRIVHDYLNVDMSVIEALIKEQKYQLQVQFLLTPINSS